MIKRIEKNTEKGCLSAFSLGCSRVDKERHLKLTLVLFLLATIGCAKSEVEYKHQSNQVNRGALRGQQSRQFEKGNPEDVLMNYLVEELKAGVSGRSSETYRLISHSDKDAVSEDDYLSNDVRGPASLSQTVLSAFIAKTSHTIKTSVVEGDTATVQVETSAPRLPENLQKAIMKEGDPEGGAELEERLISYLTSQEMQLNTGIDSYQLVRESDGWRVFLNLAKGKKIRILVEEAEKLAPSLKMLVRIDGEVLESMKTNLLSAQDKYKEALSLGEDYLAKSRLQELEKQIRALRFYEQYKDKVEIRSIQVGEGQHGGKGVFGEIKNNSDVALTHVGIKIYFLDSSDKPVHESTYHPIYITERSYGEEAIPLKPNYTRRFGVKTDDAPNDWTEKVRVVLTDVRAE